MSAARDATVAARIPYDLREDLNRVVELRRERGETRTDGDPVDLSTIIRATLRALADAELGRAGAAGRRDDPAARSLFSPRPDAHHSAGPATERAAASAVAPRTGTERRRVLETIVSSGGRGLTADELLAADQADGRNPAGNGPARRVSELAKAGAITPRLAGAGERLARNESTGPRHVGDPVTRPTRAGHPATVYIATALGREWLNTNRSQAAPK